MAMELCSLSAPVPSLQDKTCSPLALFKLPSSEALRHRLSTSSLPSKSFIAAAAWLAGGPASAISYDDVTVSLPPMEAPADVDVGAIADSVTRLISDNPLAVIAGVAVVAIPLVVSSLFSQPKPWGTISAKEALNKLGTKDGELLDIRAAKDIKAEGTPDLRTLKKRVYQIAYTPGEDEAYLKKLLAKFKDPSSTTLYILDQFDGNSLSLAKFLTASGFKNVYAIKDGAEGPNGWRRNELPWILPQKGFTLDLAGLKDVIDSTFNDNPNWVPATLGVAAAAGVSLVVFSEAETALQLLGSAALIQLFVKKFLFAKDRQKTIQELQTFLDTKIAPKELVDELKGIGGVLLPKYEEVAPAGATNGAAATSESSQAALLEAAAPGEQVKTEVETKEVEAKETDSPVPEMPLASAPSAGSTDLPYTPTPLSPYTKYPGLKPPSSPTPSRP